MVSKMKNARYVRSFRELLVYRKANEVAKRIFDISRKFPKEEVYSLTDQIRRSSRSIGAQIAEAWGKRRYEKHFVSKLTDADAERVETQHWLDVTIACEYISKNEREVLETQLEEIGRMLNAMMAKSHLFCKQGYLVIKEEPNEFLIDDT
ncbi:MAG: four helix bundle protein [Thermodesulfobacteriota bacterium]